MSVKKLLILSAAGLAAIGATAAMAGGPDQMAMPVAPAFQHSLYVEGHLGGGFSNWNSFNSNGILGEAKGPTVGAAYSPGRHRIGGFAWGLDLGYNVTQHIAAEVGWMDLAAVSGAVTSRGTSTAATGYAIAVGSTIKVYSWLSYAAGKFSVPVADHLDLFGKVGVAYRSLSYSPRNAGSTSTAFNASTSDGHYWAPIFGAGLQYNWGDWILGGQYLHLPKNTEVNRSAAVLANTGAPDAAPSLNLYTGYLGYKFNV